MIKDLVRIPYDTKDVRKAIEEEKDLDSLRTRIYRAIKDSYDDGVDRENVERVADACLEEGIRLVGGRFSRAFYIDAMLLASSKVVSGSSLKAGVTKLEKAACRLSMNFKTRELRECGINSGFMLPDIQRVVNLASKDTASIAEIEGIIGNLKESLRKFESLLLEKVDSIESEKAKQVGSGKSGKGKGKLSGNIAHDRRQITSKIDSFRKEVSAFEQRGYLARRRDAAFVVFFQRIFPIDAINMGMLNEKKDPFFGEDDEVIELIEKSSSNMYVSPNLRAWLRKCDDWVEALPAYASYRIVPSDGNYRIEAWVQRSILEDMYRRHAEDWALNIEEVMDLEHISLARDFVVEKLNLKNRVLQTSGGEKITGEEAVRRILRRKGWSHETATVAAVIDECYKRLCKRVAEVSTRDRISRLEALEKVIKAAGKRENPFSTLLSKRGKSFIVGAEGIVKRNNLRETVRRLEPLALKKRRPLPCAHVLTTLGPGETEINIRNWLEESMALFNVCRAYGFEEKVKERVKRYRDMLVSSGRHIIDEFALQGELYNLAREEKGSSDQDDSEAVLKLIASYPEVASEVEKLAVIIEKTGDKFKPGDEPVRVLKYISEHPEIEEGAIEKVISNNSLEGEVNKQVNKRMDRSEACRRVVSDTPNYATELKSITRSLARSRVIEELGISGETGRYLKSHLDPASSTTIARREMIGEEGLSEEVNGPRFRYEATGPFKKYNLLYTPSRVDLGAEEVRSVKNVPKWTGGLDWTAAMAGKSLYSLYNVAGPTAVESPRLTEFLKVGENFFSRGGVFYLSLASGVNIDALGIGDFEFFRDEWNKRGDRIVLPAGETYGGFCVPKEFSLLYAIVIAATDPETRVKIMDSFHVDKRVRGKVVEDLRKLLQERVECADDLEWEQKAAEFLRNRYREYFAILPGGGYVARLPQLVETMEKAGVMAGQFEKDKRLKYEFAYWVDKKAQGLEEINRSGPFRKIYLIKELVKAARVKNPNIAPDNKLIGVMGASYKEGERKHGKEVPVTDVRFSAGSRKLEIYAGLAEQHLLKDIDPEGRNILRRMFLDFVTPADIRMVGTCTGSDILNHVPASGLEEVKEKVYAKLLEAGLDDNLIDANCAVYGGDPENWSGIKEKPEQERRKLIDSIAGKIHLLVVDRRGVFRTYEEAVQAVDFVDLSIPDPELLDLIDNLPKFLYLMRKGRPDSALVFADGTSGARRRAFSYRYSSSKRKVKELLALDKGAVYGALGLGIDTIDSWRREMEEEREKAGALLDALVKAEYDSAQRIYCSIIRDITGKGRIDNAIGDELKARELGLPLEYYRYASNGLSRVAGGLPLHRLDFGTWLILGGQYLVNGMLTHQEVGVKRRELEKAVSKIPPTAFSKGGAKGITPFKKAEVDRIIELFFTPRYEVAPEEMYREVETGIAGSLKAVEEKVSRLGKTAERQRQTRKARLLAERSEGFASVSDGVEELIKAGDFEKASENARSILQNVFQGERGTSSMSQPSLGKFIGWTRACQLIILLELLGKRGAEFSAVEAEIAYALSGGEIEVERYQRIASYIGKAAENAKGNHDLLENVATALEFLDAALLIQKTTGIETEEEMLVEIARFFDVTLNSHIFDYMPYHYTKLRGAGFEVLNRREKFELAEKHHRWLYTYIRHLMLTETVFSTVDGAYQQAWLGDADRDILPIGVNPPFSPPLVRGVGGIKEAATEDGKSQKFWFSYARLRDAAVLMHEGYPMPEIFDRLDPDLIKGDERTNVVIVYPHGNTTVPVALEQGGKLSEKEGINLILSAFPSIVQDPVSRRKVLQVDDGLMYISRADYTRIKSEIPPPPLVKGDQRGIKEAAGTEYGERDGAVLVLARFARPVIGHAMFFHFTHPMRPTISDTGAPLIQPFVWEAATHLKCRLPAMLKGSGVRCPSQVNWYQRDTGKLSAAEARKKIQKKLSDFSRRHPTIIVKPEKESGGRNARILPVREDGKVLGENLSELTELVYAVSKTDNVAIQEVIACEVRRLYTKEFLEDLVDRFARMGIPVRLDRSPETPLFSYFRQILIRGSKGYEISHDITVLSTQGIANVGQGGLLYEYRDEIIDEKYRDDLRREITKAAYDSVNSQREYIKAHTREILRDYLSFHTEYLEQLPMDKKRLPSAFTDTDIPYEMGDYMAVFLVDEEDNLVRIYDRSKEELVYLFDDKGKPTSVKICDRRKKPVPRVDKNRKALPIPMFDEEGKRIARFDSRGNPISTLMVYKIEANPGAGLWRPHNDQLPPEREGEGVYRIFRCLGERGKAYKDKQVHPCLPAGREPGTEEPEMLLHISPRRSDVSEPDVGSKLAGAIKKAREQLHKE